MTTKHVFTFALGLTTLSGFTAEAQKSPASLAHNPFAGATLYVDPSSNAQRQADAWKKSRPEDAAIMKKMAQQPTVLWFGDWNLDIKSAVSSAVSRITKSGALPVFVAYNIPSRDCGSYSRGGASGANKYQKWIRDFAAGLTGKSVVILEPDALAASDCLKGPAKEERFALLRDAIAVLKAKNAAVYIDAGHARWIAPADMTQRLAKAGVDKADGFTLNISNFISTAANMAYGEKLSKQLGGKHFLIDTSRNGTGGAGGAWCNPAGQAVGAAPTTHTGNPLVDALLWVKKPGESDGECNGGPKAGAWWSEYALGLARSNANMMVAVAR